jgi:type IV pilus assembly protein PilF
MMLRPDRFLLVALTVVMLAGCAASGGGRSSDPDSANAIAAANQVQMGRAYMQRGQLQIALERLTKALQLDPYSTDAHTVIAVLYEEIRRPDRAETHYRRATELKPDDGSVNNNYGQFLCRGGRYPEAEQRFMKAIDDPFYPTPALAYSNAGLCALNSGLLEQAEKHLRSALELDPANGDTLLDMARLQKNKGELLRARAFLQRHEAISAPAPDALELGIAIEDGLGDAAAAERYRDRLRSEFPDHQAAQTLPGEPAIQ